MKASLILLIFTLIASCNSPGNNCIDESKINPDAICTMIYKPVCGCNNKTYASECVATNAGVTQWTEGECPDTK